MAIEQKIVCICDLCGYMVEANGDGIGCAGTPDTWSHGKSGNIDIDICPRCAKKLETPEWNPRRPKGFSYADARKK